jgi:DNA-binding CsgD family transcriptional regulator
MKSVEQQLRALTSMVLELQNELDSLKKSTYSHPWVLADSGNSRHVRPASGLPLNELAAISGLELGLRIARFYPSTRIGQPNPDPMCEEVFDLVPAEKAGNGMPTPLTRRETQILTYVADGCTNRQIAALLRISEQTIKNHVSAILRKLHANDRTHAVTLALRHGWFDTESKPEAKAVLSSRELVSSPPT